MKPELIARIEADMEAEAVRNQHPADFPALPRIPADRYRDGAFWELEREWLWPRTWLLAAHADELPEPGSYRLWERTGSRVLVVRGKDGGVRAFHDVCRHRGGALVAEAEGRVRNFTCRFHSWVYDLEGRLVGVPDAGDFRDLDKSCLGLQPLRCERWGGWIFVCQDMEAGSLADFLGPVRDEMAQCDPEGLRHVGRHRVPLDCNWKVAMDAFLEVYHLRQIHPGTIHALLDPKRTHIGLFRGGHSRMVSAKRPEMLEAGFGMGAPELPTLGPLPRTASVSYFIFPNILVPADTRGFPTLQFWPVDAGHSELEISWLAGDWGGGEVPKHWRDAVTVFDMVVQEDLENLRLVQRSLASPAMEGMKVNYQERRIYHFEQQIDEAMGRDRVPAEMRLEPLTQPHIEDE
jgi:phenylpropionate dioxygenase-like ring-hydroxylating dioxygenase large terminal subunit